MPIDETALGSFANISAVFGVKAFLVLFLIFYNILAVILFRQIQMTSSTLPTVLTPFLKFVGILHIGISLAVLFFVIGTF